MTDISISSDFWAGRVLPEGILERWRVADGSIVGVGDVIAEVRIEDALHELTAPAQGRLVKLSRVNQVIEPGSVIGRIG
jgi:pyruvate/2-oxoglutarate dehydrogenase complex dihydrolipoamide acyltransferase (E2) component